MSIYRWIATVDASWNTLLDSAGNSTWALVDGPGNPNGYPGVGDTALFDQGSANCTTGMALTVAAVIIDGWVGTLNTGGYTRRMTITERFYFNSGAVNWDFENRPNFSAGSKLEIGPNAPDSFDALPSLSLTDMTIELHRDFTIQPRLIYLLASGTITVKGQTGNETLTLSSTGTNSGTLTGSWDIQDAILMLPVVTYSATLTIVVAGTITGNGVLGIRAHNNNNSIMALSGGVFDCEVTLLDRNTNGAYHSIVSFVNCEIKKLTNRTTHTRPRFRFNDTKINDWNIALISGLVYEAQQIGDLEITGSVTTSGDGSATFTQDAGLFVLFSGDDQLVDWPFGTETQCLIRSTGGTKEYKNINAATNGFLHGGDLIIGDGATIATRDSGIQGIESTTVSATGTLLIADGQPIESNSVTNNGTILQEPNSEFMVGVIPEGSAEERGTATNNGTWKATWEDAPEGWETGTSRLLCHATVPPVQNVQISSYITLEYYGDAPMPIGTLTSVPASGTSFVGQGSVTATISGPENAVESTVRWFRNGTLIYTGGFSRTIALTTIGANSISCEIYNVNGDRLTLGPLSFTVTAYPLPSATIIADKTSGTVEDDYGFSLADANAYTNTAATTWELFETPAEEQELSDLIETHTGATFTVEKPERGVYTVQATLTGQGGTATRTVDIVVAYPAPTGTLSLSATQINLGQSVTATILNGQYIEGVAWSLNGISQSGVGLSNTFTPTTTGEFTIRALIANQDESLPLTAGFTVVYADPEILNFVVIPSSPFIGEEITVNITPVDESLVEKYLLKADSGGDEIESESGQFIITYNTPGTKTLTASIVGKSGDTVDQEKQVVVSALPDPIINVYNVNPTTADIGDEITAIVAVNDSRFVVEYGFVPGDGTSEIKNSTGFFSHRYESAGSFDSQGVAYGSNGSRVLSNPIVVTVNPPLPDPAPEIESIEIYPAIPFVGEDIVITITPDHPELVSKYLLTPEEGDAETESDTGIFEVNYDTTGVKTITAKLVSLADQTTIGTKQIEVREIPADVTCEAVPQNPFVDEIITLAVALEDSEFAAKYGMIPENGSSEVFNDTGIFTHRYSVAGEYEPQIKVYNEADWLVVSGKVTVIVRGATGQSPEITDARPSPVQPTAGGEFTLTITVAGSQKQAALNWASDIIMSSFDFTESILAQEADRDTATGWLAKAICEQALHLLENPNIYKVVQLLTKGFSSASVGKVSVTCNKEFQIPMLSPLVRPMVEKLGAEYLFQDTDAYKFTTGLTTF